MSDVLVVDVFDHPPLSRHRLDAKTAIPVPLNSESVTHTLRTPLRHLAADHRAVSALAAQPPDTMMFSLSLPTRHPSFVQAGLDDDTVVSGA